MSRVTMEDIAEQAGVSVNTVSRALNDKPDINDKTKKEILEIADELNYRPNRFARGLRSSKTSTLGVIVADIMNPFFSALLKGIEKAAREEGYSIIVQDTDENYQNEQEAVEIALAEQVDGLLITPVQTNRKTIENLQQSGIPFVLVGRHFDGLETPYVVTDDVEGAMNAVDHLVGRGHENIALVNGPSHISSSKERLTGYRRALESHGLPLRDSYVLGNTVTMEEGYEMGNKLLQVSPRPTAVVCYSDFVAVGVMRAIRDSDLSIPDELGVVGYDDVFFSNCLEVSLTTVRIPKKELGRRSLKVLQALIEKKDGAEGVEGMKLDTELIVREST